MVDDLSMASTAFFVWALKLMSRSFWTCRLGDARLFVSARAYCINEALVVQGRGRRRQILAEAGAKGGAARISDQIAAEHVADLEPALVATNPKSELVLMATRPAQSMKTTIAPLSKLALMATLSLASSGSSRVLQAFAKISSRK